MKPNSASPVAPHGPHEPHEPHEHGAGLSVRQRQILACARACDRKRGKERGTARAASLARRFTVARQTIRRDLNHLCSQHHLQRIHGAAAVFAAVLGGVANLGYAARQALRSRKKRRIGRAAAEIIPDDCFIIINIGAATEQAANCRADRHGLLVIANNINAVTILLPNKNIKALAAGIVRHEDGGLVGESTANFINRFKADFTVIGASALDGTMLDFDFQGVRVTQSMINNSRSAILA